MGRKNWLYRMLEFCTSEVWAEFIWGVGCVFLIYLIICVIGCYIIYRF